jgi:hypothetical protein
MSQQSFLQKGSGWRLGWNPEAQSFPGLVGAEDWAVELTQEELQDFCRLSQQLADTLQSMAGELMAEERISCEAESQWLWLEAEGFPQAYELRLMVLTGRRSEGTWLPQAVSPLMKAVKILVAQLES